VSEKKAPKKDGIKICLLGASFDTGNLGVSALAESSIKIILHRWPDAQVTLLGSASKECEEHLYISGREVRVGVMRIRFCKNVFLRSHFCVLLLNALLVKLVPWGRFKSLLASLNPYVGRLLESEKVYDITGGDSFSDIYGLQRFLTYGFLQKWLVTLYGKELILLPQTYGPCERRTTRFLARRILRRAGTVYARDRASVEAARRLLGRRGMNGKVRFVPDVAFVLDSHKPGQLDVGLLTEARLRDSVVVGLNISGLLFNGGYTQENMFGLRTDYRELVYRLIEFLMRDEHVLVLLVPHVLNPDQSVEDDADACLKVYESLRGKYPGRLFLTRGSYSHNDIKHVIGLCDFFIGSRMHSCIAALSQFIPTVGLAYSKKFKGVFESAGVQDYVADACSCRPDELIRLVGEALAKREDIHSHLTKVIPEMQAKIINMLEAQHGA
jgi:colanic acid/amylovoran biosynthesis protein WcaK/AmsJ